MFYLTATEMIKLLRAGRSARSSCSTRTCAGSRRSTRRSTRSSHWWPTAPARRRGGRP
ncbi:hypothetical protein ACFQX6_23385 [Streptosporangium lutulentum]